MKLKDLVHLVNEIDDLDDDIKRLLKGEALNGPSVSTRIGGVKVRVKTIIEREE